MEGSHASRLTDEVSVLEEGSFPEHSFPDSQSVVRGPRVASGADSPHLLGTGRRGCGSGVCVKSVLSFWRYFPGLSDCLSDRLSTGEEELPSCGCLGLRGHLGSWDLGFRVWKTKLVGLELMGWLVLHQGK